MATVQKLTFTSDNSDFNWVSLLQVLQAASHYEEIGEYMGANMDKFAMTLEESAGEVVMTRTWNTDADYQAMKDALSAKLDAHRNDIIASGIGVNLTES